MSLIAPSCALISCTHSPCTDRSTIQADVRENARRPTCVRGATLICFACVFCAVSLNTYMSSPISSPGHPAPPPPWLLMCACVSSAHVCTGECAWAERAFVFAHRIRVPFTDSPVRMA
jgi:hypothetical protein